MKHRPKILGRLEVICALALLALTIGAGPARAQAAPQTVVSLTFNDAFVSQYNYARPILRSHNMNGTFFVTSGAIDKGYACCVTWAQADDLYRDGNEIGGFGRDRLDLTQVYNSDPVQDYNYKRAQVCDDRQRLVGLGYDPRSFAYPYGAYNYTFPGSTNTVEGIVQACGYSSGRPVGGLSATGPVYAETLPPQDPYALRTWSDPSSSAISLQSLQDAVTAAASHGGGWVPLAFNEVCHQGSANYSACMSSWQPIDDAVFSALLDWLTKAGQAGGAPAGTVVRTVRQAMGAPAQPVLAPRPTVVSLTFDDGRPTQYLARTLLQNNNMKGTFYLNSGLIDLRDGGAMTWAQARTLQSQGHDMGGHTKDHVDLIDPNTTTAFKTQQVCDDRSRIIQQGITNPVSFAYPFGAYNAAAEAIVQGCGYSSGRSAGSVSVTGPVYAETIPPRDRFGTWALNGENNLPIRLQYLKDAVTAAATHGGGWVQLVFHDICFANRSDYAECMGTDDRPMDSAQFNSFLVWLRTAGQSGGAPAGTTVKTVRQVMSG
jgi:peptidoglycan/xylan/chitin deacetylase (PgdA/CDA1 family)